MYYNTNKETGSMLEQSIKKTESQEEFIYDIFRKNMGYLTPCEVHRHTPWPITSVRRAINTLTAQGKLVKSNKMKVGVYGKKVHCWYIPGKQLELFN